MTGVKRVGFTWPASRVVGVRADEPVDGVAGESDGLVEVQRAAAGHECLSSGLTEDGVEVGHGPEVDFLEAGAWVARPARAVQDRSGLRVVRDEQVADPPQERAEHRPSAHPVGFLKGTSREPEGVVAVPQARRDAAGDAPHGSAGPAEGRVDIDGFVEEHEGALGIGVGESVGCKRQHRRGGAPGAQSAPDGQGLLRVAGRGGGVASEGVGNRALAERDGKARGVAPGPVGRGRPAEVVDLLVDGAAAHGNEGLHGPDPGLKLDTKALPGLDGLPDASKRELLVVTLVRVPRGGGQRRWEVRVISGPWQGQRDLR